MLTATTPQTNHSPSAMPSGSMSPAAAPVSASVLAHYQIIRRNGAVVSFEPSKIAVAMMKAFLAVHGTQGAASASVRETVDELTQAVVRALMRSRPGGGTFHIEDVQDQVELGLMRGGHHEVARAYVLYRERRAQERAAHQAEAPAEVHPTLHVTDHGQRIPLDQARLEALGFPQDVLELQAYFAPAGPNQAIQAVPGAGLNVPLWILGSSLFGSQLAAELGIRVSDAEIDQAELSIAAQNQVDREGLRRRAAAEGVDAPAPMLLQADFG